MRLLLCVFFALAYGQGTGLRFRTQDREALTNQQSPQGSNTAPLPGGNGFLTSNEKNFLFTSQTRGRGNFLYSVPATGNFNDQKLLSQADIALPNGGAARKRGGAPAVPATGVQDFVVSPDQSYVLFTSKVQSNVAKEQQFTVGINGGSITEVTPKGVPPAQIPGSVRGQVNFRPCPCGVGQNSDQWLQFLASSFGGCMSGGCSDPISEIWRNTRGGDAKKINVDLGQKADEPGNKAISGSPSNVFSDYVFYTANPGPNGANDPRNLYMADWNGNNWKVTSTSAVFVANATMQPTIIRSGSGCQANGKYVAYMDYTTSLNYRTVNLFNIDTKTSITISPDLDMNSACTMYGFSRDQSQFFFKCRPAGGSDTVAASENLYAYKTAGGSAAKVISLAYSQPNGGTLTRPSAYGDYLVFTQKPLAETERSGLVSYNWVTEATATALFTEASPNTYSQFAVADKAGSYTTFVSTFGNVPFSQTRTNTAHVWYTVQSNATTRELFAVPISGAAGSGVSVVGNLISATPVSASPCVPASSAPKCEALDNSCRCSGCASSSCSNWVVFTALVNGETNTNLWTAQYNGQGLTRGNPDLTPNKGVSVVNNGVSVGHPFANPLTPFVYFYAITGAENAQVNNLYVVRAGSSSATQLGPNPIGPLENAGPPVTYTARGASAATLSGDRKWIAFHSQTTGTPAAPLVETYMASADGVGGAQKVSPATLSTDHTAAGVLKWAASKYLIHFVQDFSMPTDQQRNVMYSSSASLTPTIRDIGPNATFGNPITSGIYQGGFSTDCSETTVIYQTQLLGSPSQIYSVSLTQANPDTVCVSFNPFINVGAQGMIIRKGSFRVDFSGFFFSSQSNDRFWNTASGSMLMPGLIAMLALVAAMLF